MRRIRDFVDRDTLIPVYNVLIRPHFGYCSKVWDTLGNGLANRLQKLQNRAARVVLGMSNDIPGSEALDMLGWEPLETRRAKTKAVHMYKVLNGSAPSSLADLFVPKSDIIEYDLRGSHTSLQLPHPKTEKLTWDFKVPTSLIVPCKTNIQHRVSVFSSCNFKLSRENYDTCPSYLKYFK